MKQKSLKIDKIKKCYIISKLIIVKKTINISLERKMSREFRIINNKIEINDSSVEFMYLIKSAKAVDDRIIVLLEIPYDIDEADNLYCLSKNGTII